MVETSGRVGERDGDAEAVEVDDVGGRWVIDRRNAGEDAGALGVQKVAMDGVLRQQLRTRGQGATAAGRDEDAVVDGGVLKQCMKDRDALVPVCDEEGLRLRIAVLDLHRSHLRSLAQAVEAQGLQRRGAIDGTHAVE